MQTIQTIHDRPKETGRRLRWVIPVCGIVSSILYAGTDVLAGLLWPGYSWISQPISDLSAIGAPTRSLVVALGFVHGLLMIIFGLGTWRLGGKRAVRIIGGLLVGYAVVGFAETPFPIHLAGSETSLTDTVHSILTALIVVLITLAMILGAMAYGKRFRLYSIGTLMTFVGLGIVSIVVGNIQISLQQAPPVWFGAAERVTVYGFLLWVIIFALILLNEGRITLGHSLWYRFGVRKKPEDV